MKLVGAHQILGLLADLALNGGQQLRRHGGVQDVLQHVGEILVLFQVVPGHIVHQMAHQGLGDGGIDAVHAHVVAVIGGPAQSQLTEIAGADDKTAGLVGDVHKHLGPLPGLSVLKGDGVVLHAVADVLEVALDGVTDGNGAKGGPHPLCQDHGVVFGAVGGAKARHGHGNDVRGGPAQHTHGKSGDEKGQRGVKAAAQTHHCRSGAGVLQPLFEAHGGDGQNLLAPVRPVGGVLRHKGGGGDVAGDGGLAGGELRPSCGQTATGGITETGLRREGGQPPPLIHQPLYVDLADGKAGGKAFLRQKGAVFGDHVVAGKHQVGGGFSLPGIGVDVAAAEAAGLAHHQLTAVGGLAHHLVGGGEVQDNGGPGLRQTAGGGIGGP